MSTADELALEQRARSLEGQRLTAVRYQRASTRSPRKDSDAVDHAVWLEFGARKVAIEYGDDFALRHGFGVTLRDKRVVDPAFGPIEDVSRTPRWAPHIGRDARPVTRARIVWEGVFDHLRSSLAIGVAIHADYLTRADYPAALELCFGDARLLVMAARIGAGGELVPFVPALLVL